MKNILLKKTPWLSALFLLLLTACSHREVKGIRIGDTLYQQQDWQENRELCMLIERNLEGDPEALRRIAALHCGDGAGCYDLGQVITQIIYRRGEKDFAETIQQAGPGNLPRLKSLIRAGLEYGDQEGDGHADERSVEETFPLLNKMLSD
ncbi:MAG: hypothetical protein IBJ09_02850 [Bacteroidia bacterium]|nr:hypothetical protein [Bacteroidia bacterium]